MRRATLLLLLTACYPTNNTPVDPQQPDPSSAPTYWRDIQPLIAQSCQGCHTQGGIAPFALDTYAQAKTHTFALAAATASRQMPPWMPEEEGCVPLRESRRLSDAQVKLFTAWAEGGALEGEVKAPMPAKLEKPLERVDVTLKPAVPYTPQAGLTDDYRCFALPHGQASDRDIVGINIKPGVRQMVHHVIVYALDPALAKSQDDASPGEGWECFAGPGQDGKMLGGWVPGTSATQYPSGTGITLPANQTVVIQVHYNVLQSGAQADETSLEIQFAEGRVARPAEFTALANWWFNLPPMTMGQTVGTTFNIPAGGGGTVWGVFPHMHTKGKAISVSKNGQCLMNVKQWDFHWQQSFFFASETGLQYRPGEQVALSCTFDNPTSASVTWGERTSDEMCLAFFYVTK